MRARHVLVSVWAVGLLGTTALTQAGFRDDAGRTVEWPARVSRVFAAGAPAEVMLHTLAPELLVGRNRMPSAEMRAFFPPAFRNSTPIQRLPEVDNPDADAELVALRPDVYIDYGTVSPDYIESLEAVQRRTRVPGIILDGALERIPEMYRRLGGALGVQQRGDKLATTAAHLLASYRDALAGPAPTRVYLACSADGFVPCLADQRAGEQLAWLGGINVAGTQATAPRRPLTIDDIQALAPQVIIVTSGAARYRSDPAWQGVDAVRAGRVYQWPALPYGWGARPPSVNRLPGVVWLAYVAAGRRFDEEFRREVRRFYEDFYQVELTDALFTALGLGL